MFDFAGDDVPAIDRSGGAGRDRVRAVLDILVGGGVVFVTLGRGEIGQHAAIEVVLFVAVAGGVVFRAGVARAERSAANASITSSCSASHLKRILSDYFDYYNNSRTHLSLDRNPPNPREVEPPERGPVRSIPQVGGLHHRYIRAA